MGVGVLAVAGLLVAFVPRAGAQPPRSVPLQGSISPAAGNKSLIPIGGSASVGFELVLSPRDVPGAQALAQAVSTPGSASYRQYLTPAQWEARFSPTSGEIGEVRAWLRSQGLRARSVSADRLTIDVSGSTARVEQAFNTALAYRVVRGQRLQLAERDLSVPSTLAGIVVGALGVNQTPSTPSDVVSAARRVASAGSSPRRIQPPPGRVVAPPCSGFYGQAFDTTSPPYGHGYSHPLPTAVCGYTPAQIRQAYGVSGLVNARVSGTGQTVAIIDAYSSPTLLTDAQSYARLNDPTHPLATAQFSEMGGRRFNSKSICDASGWFGEQALDVEAVHAVAPGAHIVYYGTKNCLASLYDALRTVVDRHAAEVVNASWGDNAGDVLDDGGTRTAVDNTLMMAAATGVSVVFASGDNGDEFTTTGTVAPDYPASSPWATAVGGTTLESGFGIGEYGWSTASSELCTQALVGLAGCSAARVNTWLAPAFQEGSGGGTSFHYAQPAYQAGVVPPSLSTSNAAEVGPAPKRVEPDVSMDGDPATGLLVGMTQTFPSGHHYSQLRAGGTSLSTPLFAGIVALADQLAGKSMGFLNPALYTLARSQSGVLYDVGAAPLQAQSLTQYLNSLSASGGLEVTTRIVDYQGSEAYCAPAGRCASRTVAIAAGRGYDDMTGVGVPRTGFVPALAKL
jgi:subtilase family serine protease